MPHIQVIFIGEGGIDYGGPRREFFRLLAVSFGKELMIGDSSKFMMPDVTALQVNMAYTYFDINNVINHIEQRLSYYGSLHCHINNARGMWAALPCPTSI